MAIAAGTQSRFGSFGWFTPVLLLLGSVTAYPAVTLFWLSLNETRFFEPVRFVGLRNYADMLSSSDFRDQAVTSGLFLAGTLALALTMGLGAALLVQALGRFWATVLRTVLLLPWTLSMTVVGCLWLWLLNPSYGPVRYGLSLLAVPAGLMLGDPDLALPLLVVATAWWSFPYAMVLISASLQGIPQELYEAVAVDGGSALDRFRHVTLPGIVPTLGSTGLLMAIMYLTLVSLILVMTGGGPFGGTTTFSYAIYQQTVDAVDISPAAVLSVAVLAVNAVLGVAYQVLSRRLQGSPT